jgi:hypothetical protein
MDETGENRIRATEIKCEQNIFWWTIKETENQKD